MSKGIDFRQKEVVNINDGKVLGYVSDINAQLDSGEISSIIVAASGKILNIFSGKNNLTIPWNKIIKIGEDVILVDV